MAQRVIIDYSDLSDNDLNEFVASVFHSLTGNTNFTWGVDVLTGYKAKCDDFNTKLLAARTNDTVKLAEKNESRVILLDETHDLAQEVNRQADGNVAKLLSSGFILVKDRGIIGSLDTPTGFKVVNGLNPGEFVCSMDANSDAVMYFFYFAPVPAPADIDDWKLKPSTKHKKLFKGFKSGQQYAIKCAYQGRVEDLNYSETIFIYAQ